jgi:hypothetical protein
VKARTLHFYLLLLEFVWLMQPSTPQLWALAEHLLMKQRKEMHANVVQETSRAALPEQSSVVMAPVVQIPPHSVAPILLRATAVHRLKLAATAPAAQPDSPAATALAQH